MSDLKQIKSPKEIQTRVKEIGRELTEKFKGIEPVVIGILNGSFMFYADLIRHLELEITCEFLGVSSYRDGHVSSGEVALTLDLELPLSGRDVIIVEDMVDSGLTMNYLVGNLKARNPKSITTVVLLSRPSALTAPLKLDYVGFELLEKEFVVGYGLDSGGQYRNLPYLAIVP